MEPNDRLSFLGRDLPASFVLRLVTLEPHSEQPYREEDWSDAIVVVEQGELELECRAGGRKRFQRGAILWLVGLPIRILRNRGDEPTVIAAVSRSAMSFVPVSSPSCGVDHESRGETHD